MVVRCIICSRVIEEEVVKINTYDDEDVSAKKPMVVCLRCEAKLKHEADEAQKMPKPL